MIQIQKELQIHNAMAKEKAIEHARRNGLEESVFQELDEIREIWNMITRC